MVARSARFEGFDLDLRASKNRNASPGGKLPRKESLQRCGVNLRAPGQLVFKLDKSESWQADAQPLAAEAGKAQRFNAAVDLLLDSHGTPSAKTNRCGSIPDGVKSRLADFAQAGAEPAGFMLTGE